MAIDRLGKLTSVERRTALALANERARLMGELQECDEAIKANVVTVAERMKLPPGEYLLEQMQDGSVMLVKSSPDPGPSQVESTAEEEGKA